MNPADLPDESPAFHRKSMIGCSCIILISLIPLFIGYWQSHDSPNSPLTDWCLGAFGFCVVWLMGYMLYRALYARPDCPACGQRIKESGSPVEINQSTWRIYRCPLCTCEFRIPSHSPGD